MAKGMKVNFKTIKEKEKEPLHGQMEDNILGNGRMESNTTMVLIKSKMKLEKMENGKMEEKYSGLNDNNRLMQK